MPDEAVAPLKRRDALFSRDAVSGPTRTRHAPSTRSTVQGALHGRQLPDRLIDILWRTLSASGELRWIEDLDVLKQIASAYDLLAVEVELEKQWQAARALRGEGKVVSYDHIANELNVHDFHVWTGACRACKAMDAALLADGAAPGGEMVCPHG